jgi:hypothetical protein
MNSLAPSAAESSNSILLHQLSNNPREVLPIRRADLNDARIHNPKMSPFPGMEKLAAPPLPHLHSDSIVPTQQYVQTPAPIYTLPLPTAEKRESDSSEATSKRNWLSRAFGQATSPRSSGSTSRNGSISKSASASRNGSLSDQGHPALVGKQVPAQPSIIDTALFESQKDSIRNLKHSSASPTVSVVPELNEERQTAFLTTPDSPTAPTLPQKSIDVLTRMDKLLALGPDDPARPDILDDPPRKLLAATQVLQVVNVNVRFIARTEHRPSKIVTYSSSMTYWSLRNLSSPKVFTQHSI